MRDYDYALMHKEAFFKKRVSRLDEQIKTIREIWNGEFEHPGAPKIGPEPIQPGGPKIFSSSLGPKSMARAAVWAAGLAGFHLTGDMAELKALHDNFLAQWQAAGRTGKPWMQVALWFSLGENANIQLKAFAKEYMQIFSPEYAEAASSRCWLNSEEHIREAVSQLQDIGYDEIILTPTSDDLSQLEQVCDLVNTLHAG